MLFSGARYVSNESRQYISLTHTRNGGKTTAVDLRPHQYDTVDKAASDTADAAVKHFALCIPWVVFTQNKEEFLKKSPAIITTAGDNPKYGEVLISVICEGILPARTL